MASTNRTLIRIRSVPMARFSIEEDEDDAPPTTYKRPRCSEPPSQSHTAPDVEEDEDFLVEDVEPDSQDEEEEEEEEEDDDEDECEDEEQDESEDDEYALQGDYEFDYDMLASMRNSSATAAGSAVIPDVAATAAAIPDVAVSPSVVTNGNEELQIVLTDPDVLDCPICLDPLCTPVFQCENGHIACSSCCSKVNRKCPSCCMPIGYNRCRAIEKVIESAKVSCKNAQYGCTMRMMYNKKTEHEQTCPHALCFCPYPSCSVSGSSKSLYLHFGIHHAASTTRFTYNNTFTLRIERNQKHKFLQEQNESVIFILNHEVKEDDHAFNIDCLGPSSLKTSFGYQLTAKNSEATLSLHCVPEIYAKWFEHTLKKNYLRVLSDFSRCDGDMFLNVCIKKDLSPV